MMRGSEVRNPHGTLTEPFPRHGGTLAEPRRNPAGNRRNPSLGPYRARGSAVPFRRDFREEKVRGHNELYYVDQTTGLPAR